MNFMFNRVTFNDQFQKLLATRQWLDSIGVQTQNTRFDEVLRLNKEIVEHHKNNLVEELIETFGNLKLWFALTEASSFIEIHEAFKNLKSHLRPRAKLKMMLHGPYHSWDEDVDGGNIEPRNTLFELEVASKFQMAGTKIIGFDDVDFVFKKTKFNVQCKRIHSQKKVKNSISEAAAQFYKRMKARPNPKGIICLSIDKLTGKKEMILKVDSADEVRPKLAGLSNAFFVKYRSLWQNLVNTNILAVLLFVHVVATIPWQDALEIILRTNNLAIIHEGNVVRIVNQGEYNQKNK